MSKFNERNFTKDIPTYLAHKPIVACEAKAALDVDDDAKYISVGRAQYNSGNLSVKIMRHTGQRWSRQSEEVPVERIGAMMAMFLTAVKVVQSGRHPYEQSELNEECIDSAELGFMKQAINDERDAIIRGIKRVKTLIDEIDLKRI